MIEDKVEYSCDKWIKQKKSRCRKKPYCEIFILDRDHHGWSYLCKWHFIIDNLHCLIFRIKTHGYVILDKDAEGDRYK